MRIARARRLDGRWVEMHSLEDLEAVAEVLGKPLLRFEGGERPWLAVLDGAVVYAYYPKRRDLFTTMNVFDALSAVHTGVLRRVRAELHARMGRPEPYSVGGLWLEDTWHMAEEILRREVDVHGRPVRVVIQPEPEGA